MALARIHGWATAIWTALVCGAGFGFAARDLLELGQPATAAAWLAGGVLGALAARVPRG